MIKKLHLCDIKCTAKFLPKCSGCSLTPIKTNLPTGNPKVEKHGKDPGEGCMCVVSIIPTQYLPE
jgi:hypothetical protein